jgi:geranylgeranyl diphosphate synthase, type II
MIESLPEFLGSRALAVEDALARIAPQSHQPPEAVHRAMRYTLLAPSKRVRAALTLLGADLGGAERLAIPAAAAIEIVHAASLILDDLPAMDDAKTRRGRPANHLQFGEGMAILAAVGLLNLAYDTVGRAYDAPLAKRLTLLLADAIGSDGLIGGQADDLLARDRDLPLSRLELIHRRKTAVLFSAAARAGMEVAGVADEQAAALASFGAQIGLAFQIVDDLLDLDSDAEIADRPHRRLPFESVEAQAAARRRAVELHDLAVRALAPFGERARPLRQLADFVVNRKE